MKEETKQEIRRYFKDMGRGYPLFVKDKGFAIINEEAFDVFIKCWYQHKTYEEIEKEIEERKEIKHEN